MLGMKRFEEIICDDRLFSWQEIQFNELPQKLEIFGHYQSPNLEWAYKNIVTFSSFTPSCNFSPFKVTFPSVAKIGLVAYVGAY